MQAERQINTSAQKDDLLKDLEYQKGFLQSVEKKLGNERFIQNAKPEIIELERKNLVYLGVGRCTDIDTVQALMLY